MFQILACIFISFQTILCNAYITTTPATIISIPENANVETVNALKVDLLRNNDDYKDLLKNKSYVVEKTVSTLNDTVKGPIRRANDNIFKTSVTTETHANVKPKEISNETAAIESSILMKNMTSRYPKYVYKDKLRKFVEKHEGLLNEFISSKNAVSHTESAPPPPPAPRRWQGGRGVPRAKDSREAPVLDKPLTGLQLDMSPAKGGKVQTLRYKNRLCHRHVLNPEGPKYDSKGKVYLKAFAPINGQNFPQTRIPHLLLPRCCNCCQKSVLGCE